MMNTAGLQPPIDPFHAQVAGADNLFFGMILGRSKRAGFQAGFAPGAQRLIEKNDPVGPLGDGPAGQAFMQEGLPHGGSGRRQSSSVIAAHLRRATLDIGSNFHPPADCAPVCRHLAGKASMHSSASKRRAFSIFCLLRLIYSAQATPQRGGAADRVIGWIVGHENVNVDSQQPCSASFFSGYHQWDGAWTTLRATASVNSAFILTRPCFLGASIHTQSPV